MPADPRPRALRPQSPPGRRPRRTAGAGGAPRRGPDPSRPLRRRLPRGTALGLGAVLALALLALAVAQSDRGRSLLRDAGLSSPAEPYTALAFSHPDDLPQTPRAAGEIPVAFRIANHEDAGRTYAWRVVERSGGAAGTLASGRVRVARGAASSVRADVSLGCAGRRSRVAVLLEDPAREIGFWVACPGSEAPS